LMAVLWYVIAFVPLYTVVKAHQTMSG